MALPMLVGVAPSRPVQRQLVRLRIALEREVGLKHIHDDLHMTLFVNSFSSAPMVRDAVREAASRHAAFTVRGRGLSLFRNDPLLGGRPFVWLLARQRELVTLQAELFRHLAPLRTPDQHQFLATVYRGVGGHRGDDLRAYGYPYCPNDWRYHVTLGYLMQHTTDLPLESLATPASLDVQRITIFRWIRERFRQSRTYRLQPFDWHADGNARHHNSLQYNH